MTKPERGSVKRVSLSWDRRNEHGGSVVPRRSTAWRWSAWQWAWFRLEIER